MQRSIVWQDFYKKNLLLFVTCLEWYNCCFMILHEYLKWKDDIYCCFRTNMTINLLIIYVVINNWHAIFTETHKMQLFSDKHQLDTLTHSSLVHYIFWRCISWIVIRTSHIPSYRLFLRRSIWNNHRSA